MTIVTREYRVVGRLWAWYRGGVETSDTVDLDLTISALSRDDAIWRARRIAALGYDDSMWRGDPVVEVANAEKTGG